MERFSYKGWCGIHNHMHIEAFKEELALTIDKQLRIVSNKMLFKTIIPLRNQRKSRYKSKTILYVLLCDP